MKKETLTEEIPPRRRSARKWVSAGLMVVYLFAAGFVAYAAYVRTQDFVASWELTGLEGITIHNATPTLAPGDAGTPNPTLPAILPSGPKPLPWDGASRVTLLIMGLDYRSWEAGQGPPLTDTMILLTVDPVSKTAGMLSIPRDLWVNIPGGFGYDRINSAYRKGESAKLPEGGPGLAMATIEDLLGVPVDYYAIVEFHAFERFIDEIGGVKIDVPEKIVVDPLGDNNTKTLKPGRQVLPGDLALAYVRVRKGAGDDFGRAQRQQQVILGIRDRILSFDLLPHLVSRAGVLYQELSAGIHTNLTLDQVIRLAWLGTQIPEENIRQGAIAPPGMVRFATVFSAQGEKEDVLKPVPDKIRELRDEIFTGTGAIGPAPGLNQEERLKSESARVSVLNGTSIANLAGRTSDYLKTSGLNVVAADNASQQTPYTEITFYTAKPYTVGYLVKLMKIISFRIHYDPQPDSPVDVEVILGNDWANSKEMTAQ